MDGWLVVCVCENVCVRVAGGGGGGEGRGGKGRRGVVGWVGGWVVVWWGWWWCGGGVGVCVGWGGVGWGGVVVVGRGRREGGWFVWFGWFAPMQLWNRETRRPREGQSGKNRPEHQAPDQQAGHNPTAGGARPQEDQPTGQRARRLLHFESPFVPNRFSGRRPRQASWRILSEAPLKYLRVLPVDILC